MSDRAFIDTNVFIYLYSEDEVEKQGISQKAVDKYDCIISTQVLKEGYPVPVANHVILSLPGSAGPRAKSVKCT
jgi:predicted nucleic acid-binding protein